MAILWADNFDTYGLGGTDHLVEGIYAQTLLEPESGASQILDDPDPTVSGRCLALGKKIANTDTATLRMVYPGSPKTTAGAFFRFWTDELPRDNNLRTGYRFTNDNNEPQITVRLKSTGALEVTRGGDATTIGSQGGTVIGTTSPVITTGAWHHIETKIVLSNTDGSVEIRVNGVTVLSLTGIDTIADETNATIEQFCLRNGYQGLIPVTFYDYFKDLVLWDDSGTVNNDFIGTAHVYTLWPDGDSSFNWDASSGSTGYNLINDNRGSQILNGLATITDGDTVEMDDRYYRFTSGSLDASSPAGTSSNPWRVAIGASVADSMENFYNAVNASGVAGTDYSTALAAHPRVEAYFFDATQVGVQAKNDFEGFDYLCSIDPVAATTRVRWTNPTSALNHDAAFELGPTDNSYISADDTPPAASVFTMTNLPPDIVSVKALIPVVRAAKVDGGDGNIQMGLISNGSTDLGADRPMTTAFAYWYDVSEISPDTSLSYTPTEVNNILFQLDRTL